MGEFFDNTTAAHQLRSLERQYAQLQRDPGDVDAARDFFVIATHLPEWIKDRDYKRSLQQQELILQVCDELANRGKHGKSDRKYPVVLETDYDSFVERGWVEPGFFEVTLKVKLTPEAAEKLGLKSLDTDVLTLATLALEFWKAHPAFKGSNPI
jgi:hypothetical protein